MGTPCGRGTKDPKSVLSRACGYKGRYLVPLHVLSSYVMPPAYGPSVKPASLTDVYAAGGPPRAATILPGLSIPKTVH